MGTDPDEACAPRPIARCPPPSPRRDALRPPAPAPGRRFPARQTVQTLRKLHRWSAVMLALFLALIALSGTALQAIMTVYGDTGPRRAPDEPLWVVWARDLAITVHTGAFAGMTGVYVGLLCGLGLLFFSASGALLYWDLYRSRRAQGRAGPFWRTRAGKGALMRSLHRWTTVPIMLFAMLLALTGSALDLYFAWYATVPAPPQRAPDGSLANSALSAGPPPGGRLWHDLSLWLHKLDFLGRGGHAIGILIGIALLLLAASGAWMYLTLLLQRRRIGRSGLFW